MKRLHLFCGHYGSGKTNIAVNFAMRLAESGIKTGIADLDIVNPYFRTKDSESELTARGIEVISLPFANSSVDLPSLPSEAYRIIQNKGSSYVLDIGGDDRGAYALGRYRPGIIEENSYEMYFVVNFYRPLTPDAASAFEIMNEISAACAIPFTAIVNNSNLGAETTAETVISTFDEAEKLSGISGLPIAFTSADEKIAGNIPGSFPLKLQKRPID